VAGGGDHEFLLSVFLMEAWDTLAAVEQRLAQPPTPDALEDLRVVTHRLRGSAALNGFPGVSALACTMEETVDGLTAGEAPARDRAHGALARLAAALQQALDTIGATGEEDRAAIDAAVSVSVEGTAPAGTAVSAESAAPAAAGPALAELDVWLKANGDVLEYFIPEATEHLELMAQSLGKLEQESVGDDEVATLFRAVHTLKGAAYTVGCRVIGALAHRVEDLLGEVREGRRVLDQRALDTVNAGLDALRLLVASVGGVPAGRETAYERAGRLLEAVMTGAALPEARVEEPVDAEVVATAEPAALAAAVTADAASRPALVAAAPAAAPAAEARPPALRPSIRVNLDRLDALMNLVGELVIARRRLERRLGQLENLEELLLFTQSRMRNTVGEFEGKYANPHLPSIGRRAETPLPNGARAEPAAVPLDAVFGELEFDRYDDFSILARRVGEIAGDVTEAQSQLAALVRGVREEAARVQQLSGALRAEVTRSRMVPMSRLFARFARQVRETAQTAGKQVRLELSGDAVEVDNAIIDQVTDPLLHLVQNAIVHGIEPAAQRQAAGKASQGTIRLSAAHKGGSLWLEVADDGRGIDVEAVRAAALRGGFVTEEALSQLVDRDVLDLIFLPGFSTAESVTTVAGRGVGMDVVRTNVGRLGGEVDVDTTPSEGTRFVLKLPLTVAISDALLVRVGAETLAISAQAVKAMARIPSLAVRRDGTGESVDIEGERVDLVRLDRALGIPGTLAPAVLPVAVLRTGRRAIAVAVDAFLGKEEIVVKRLGTFLEDVGPFSGATVSADGQVILLLDPVRLAERRGVAAPRRAAASPVIAAHVPAAVRTVLLVDDSVSVRKFVGQMLERAGFRVVTANDGVEALERLTDLTVDVVITDLEMPRLNGYELIRDLRRRPKTREVPIAVLTTRAGDKHLQLARQLGVEHYVTKPVDEQSFVRLVASLASEPVAAETA
jgi:chemosensory pili system protein ChpA (sensor histidine kinase/response regulator)